MKQTLLLIVAVALVWCASTPKVVPNSPEAAAALDAAIRKAAGKRKFFVAKQLEENKLPSKRGKNHGRTCQ